MASHALDDTSKGEVKASASGSSACHTEEPDEPASSTSLVQLHHTNIDESVFVERARDRIVQKWTSEESGHGVCFTGLSGSVSFHRCMTDGDVDDWAREMAADQATIAQPPPYIMARISPELTVGIGVATRSYPVASRFSRAMASVTSLGSSTTTTSGSSYSGPWTNGLGSFTGSGVKGIGNIIIRGLEKGDTTYRTVQMRRLLSKVANHHGKRSLHRAIFRLVAPGQHLDGLFNDIWKSLWHCLPDDTFLEELAHVLDLCNVEPSPYLKLKWLRIVVEVFYKYRRNSPSLSNVGTELFNHVFESDEDVLAQTTHRLKTMYASCGIDNLRFGNIIFEHVLQMLLYQTVERPDGRCPSWSHLTLFPYFIMRFDRWMNQERLPKLAALFLLLCEIHCSDAYMVIDAPPTSDYSLWDSTCEKIRMITCKATTADWASENHDHISWLSIARVVNMLAYAHSVRRPALRATGVVVPLVECIRADGWAYAAQYWETLEMFPDLKDAEDAGEKLKQRAYKLARDF